MGLGGRIAGFVFTSEFPPALEYANLAAAILEIALAAGLLRGSRAAWSFALMTAGMTSVMNLFAWPSFNVLGADAAPSMIVAAARLAFVGVLLFTASGFRSTSPR